MAISRTSVWLQAFRLHTLPLAFAAISLGIFIAFSENQFNVFVAILTYVTAICLQILSNLANDYGDTKHGADNAERVGPQRMTQAGMISSTQIKVGIVVFVLLSLASGILLLIFSLEKITYTGAMFLFLLGILAIAAAIAYTASKRPYGYRGLGDISVFLFFGLLAVEGTYFLQSGSLGIDVLLPSAGMGLLCTSVLNVNNIRDLEADERAGKQTIAVRLGLRPAKIYHWLLILSSIILFVIFLNSRLTNADGTMKSPLAYLFLLPSGLLIYNAYGIWRSRIPSEVNPFLRQLVFSILLFTISFCLALNLF